MKYSDVQRRKKALYFGGWGDHGEHQCEAMSICPGLTQK